MSSAKVTVVEAAKQIGCTPDFLRQRMKRKEWDIGVVVPPAKKGGPYQYYIFRAKLDKFLGLAE